MIGSILIAVQFVTLGGAIYTYHKHGYRLTARLALMSSAAASGMIGYAVYCVLMGI